MRILRDLRTTGPPSGGWGKRAHARGAHLNDREAIAQRLPALLHDLLVDARLAIVRLDRVRGNLASAKVGTKMGIAFSSASTEVGDARFLEERMGTRPAVRLSVSWSLRHRSSDMKNESDCDARIFRAATTPATTCTMTYTTANRFRALSNATAPICPARK